MCVDECATQHGDGDQDSGYVNVPHSTVVEVRGQPALRLWPWGSNFSCQARVFTQRTILLVQQKLFLNDYLENTVCICL